VTPEVRRADAGEAGTLSDVLARAFADDPVMNWFFRGRRRPVHTRRFFILRLRHLLPQGETYTTEDRAGAAIWAVPERWRTTPLQTFAMTLAFAPAVGRRAMAAMRGMEMIEHAHPKAPHYYLAVLGTEPDLQGRGVGSALMRPVLESCDRDEIPAYLESSKERNVDFYARHGFRVLEEYRLLRGPLVWLMWRDPRP